MIGSAVMVKTKQGQSSDELIIEVLDQFQCDNSWPGTFELGKSYAFKVRLLGDFLLHFQAEFCGGYFLTDQSSVISSCSSSPDPS